MRNTNIITTGKPTFDFSALAATSRKYVKDTKSFLRGLFVIIAIPLAGCSQQNDQKVLRLAHTLDAGHPVHIAMEHIATRSEELSGGKLNLMVYPGGQLGSERELIELLQIGSLAMTKVSASPLEGFVPEMKVFSIPYIFQDNEHFWTVLNGDVGRKLLASTEPVRLKGLGYFDAGSRSFYTKDVPVRSPEDLKGLKIRVMNSQTAVRTMQELGASPTPIAWGELYTALQQSVVDGAENNPPTLFLSRQYEHARYFSLDEHASIPDVLLISTYVWDRLSEQEREWLNQAVEEGVALQRSLWNEATEDALRQIEAAGVEIIYPDTSAFQEAVQEMHKSYEGTLTGTLLEQIKETGS